MAMIMAPVRTEQQQHRFHLDENMVAGLMSSCLFPNFSLDRQNSGAVFMQHYCSTSSANETGSLISNICHSLLRCRFVPLKDMYSGEDAADEKQL